MAYVDHRTSNPAQDQYGYALVKVPDDRTTTNPKGCAISGDILPVRDIYDYANGTDTWKELHGEDIFFLLEGVIERRLAVTQFTGRYSSQYSQTWPTSWWNQYTYTTGGIYHYPYQYTIGSPQSELSSFYTQGNGLYWCHNRWFLDISDPSQLPASIMAWPGGQAMELYIPSGYEYAGKYCYDYPDVILGKLDPSQMVSRWQSFRKDSPLKADEVRRCYKDLERLNYYVLSATYSSTVDGYHYNLSSTSFAKTDCDYVNWGGTGNPPTGQYVIHEYSRAFYTYGEPQYQGMYEIYKASNGVYQIPMCGKYGGHPGSVNPMYGTEVAIYVCLRLQLWWYNGQYQPADRFGFFKLPFTRNYSTNMCTVAASDMVAAAQQLINYWGAEINHQVPQPSWRDGQLTEVTMSKMFSVCKVSDRTDINQLNWQWSPS